MYTLAIIILKPKFQSQTKIMLYECLCNYTTLMLLNTGIMHLFDNYVTSISLPWEPRFHESRGNVIRSRFIKIRLWGQGEICYVIIERLYCRVLWYGLYGLNLELLL